MSSGPIERATGDLEGGLRLAQAPGVLFESRESRRIFQERRKLVSERGQKPILLLVRLAQRHLRLLELRRPLLDTRLEVLVQLCERALEFFA